MELSKKTTNLFSPESHQRLSELAERRGVSLGTLVRAACATADGIHDQETRASAAGRAGRADTACGNHSRNET